MSDQLHLVDNHPHPKVRLLLALVVCGRCGCRPGQGLIVTSLQHPALHVYNLRTRCLLCGGIGAICFEAQDLEPGEVEELVANEVTADELIDVHRMSEEEFAASWAKVTGK